MKVVIIGGVACGAKTAARLARVCPDTEITLLERGDDLSYANCGFPFYLGQEIKARTGLTSMGFGAERNADYFDKYAFTTALTRHEAVAIDRERRQVEVKVASKADSEKNLKYFPYDKLVIATGASPIRLSVPGMDLENVFTFWTLRDTFAIEEALERDAPKKVAIVGAGLTGVEMAEALKHRGLDVTLIDVLEYPLEAIAGSEFGMQLKTHLEENGVIFYGGERLTALADDGKTRKIRKVVTDRREIDADIVIVSVGVRPNIDLARKAGLETGEKAIRVDDFMRTSDPDIYAGGDCVECKNILTGQYVWQPMGSTANRHGRVIADHIAGLNPGTRFSGVEGTAIVRVFDRIAGRTGLTLKAAEEAGFTPVEILTSNPDIPSFMPGSAMLFLRLVADLPTRRLLGAQITGPGKADKRLDVVATALKGGLTVDDLADVDLAYSPPFATALDVVTHAANALRNKMDGLMKSISPSELKSAADRGDDFIILDVRGENELRRFGKLRYELRHIPLGELKARAEELPRGREIVVVCRAAVRAWSAFAMLKRRGYTKIAVLEGGMSAWPYKTLPHP